jgi:hypothetical protein
LQERQERINGGFGIWEKILVKAKASQPLALEALYR